MLLSLCASCRYITSSLIFTRARAESETDYAWLKTATIENEQHRTLFFLRWKRLFYIILYSLYTQEKNTSALHVAAGAGQSLQVELLVIYGADPGAIDGASKNPAEYARFYLS